MSLPHDACRGWGSVCEPDKSEDGAVISVMSTLLEVDVD